MTPAKGYYSIIQFCPDLSRLEVANVGVLLFCPERDFLRARTSSDNRRIRHFFGDSRLDWKRIDSFKRGIEDRLSVEHNHIRTLQDLEAFIATRANLLQITPPRPMKVYDPEKDLDQLFSELVGGRPRVDQGMSLKRFLGQRISKAGLESKVRKDIRVVVPITGRQVEIPYGYRNGRLNLIKPAGFRTGDPDQAMNTACRYAVTGKSLFETPDPALGELQLIIVGEFGAGQLESREGVRRILDQHRVRLFTTAEVDRLIHEIRTTARDIEGD